MELEPSVRWQHDYHGPAADDNRARLAAAALCGKEVFERHEDAFGGVAVAVGVDGFGHRAVRGGVFEQPRRFRR